MISAKNTKIFSRMPEPTQTPHDAPETERLNGTVVRMTYQNRDNGYSVIKLQPEAPIDPRRYVAGGVVALVGVMPGIEVGETIEAEGQWVRDPKFGPQFKVQWFKPSLPTGVKGIEVYLASGAIKGVGPVTAKRIVETFGEATFDVLDNDLDRLVEVRGIKKGKTLQKISAGWRAARGDRELITFLGEHGVSPTIAARLRKFYGEKALSIVRANPYRLAADVRGIGFMRADVIARKIGIRADAPERIDAALGHVLERQAEAGHTYQPRPRLIELATELTEVAVEQVEERLDALLEQERVCSRTVKEETGIFILSLHDAERLVAERIERLMSSPKQLPTLDPIDALADFEQHSRFRLAPAQRQAALTLARHGVLILTGGPGTGKTTTVRSIIDLFGRGRCQVKLAAPTGRAARRLSETARLPAETIHRLLNYQAPLGKFGRDAANPIEADLVIVDEVSMLDAQLAAHLFDALSPRTCLMLVGDEDQLPSVGAGNVLGDLIAADKMPVVRLTEIFRQAGASMIVHNAHRINRGLMPHLKPVDGARDVDFYFIERESPPEVVDTIKTLVRERIPRKFHLDPHHDVQVLTPMRRGELGVEALNEEIKQLLNPNRAKGDELFGGEGSARRRTEFDKGDRVMQTANNYDKLVFNGDIGHVIHVDPNTREVVIAYDGREVSYLADEQDHLTLAYAITIHKSQGSEYPAVIVPVHTQHWIMLQRNLIYTAITRARRLVCLVGTRRALRRAVANAERSKRFTALRNFLLETIHE